MERMDSVSFFKTKTFGTVLLCWTSIGGVQKQRIRLGAMTESASLASPQKLRAGEKLEAAT